MALIRVTVRGHIESAESAADTALREMAEEIGVVGPSIEVLGTCETVPAERINLSVAYNCAVVMRATSLKHLDKAPR